VDSRTTVAEVRRELESELSGLDSIPEEVTSADIRRAIREAFRGMRGRDKFDSSLETATDGEESPQAWFLLQWEEADPDKLPAVVLARMYRNQRDRDSVAGMAVLVWPLEIADYHGREVSAWFRIGQHGGVDLRGLLDATRPATEAEAAEALAQWRSEGPDRDPESCPLLLRKRCPPWHVMFGEWQRQAAEYRADVARNPAGAPWVPPGG
jgi:hypothetical protein